MATCSTTTLTQQACDDKFLTAAQDDTLWRALVLQLLCNLVVGGGGGGTGNLSGTGSPEGVQTAAVGTLYVDTSTPGLWFKQTGAGNTGWFQFI